MRAEQMLIIQRYLSLFIIRMKQRRGGGNERDPRRGGISETGRTRDKQVRGGGEERKLCRWKFNNILPRRGI